MENKLIGHGFQKPIIIPEHKMLGEANALPFRIIQPDGDWRPFLQEGELQARIHFDTYGCTIYDTLHPIQLMEKKLFGEDNNYSERGVYIGTGTWPPGNDPHIIADWIRNNGLFDESLLPFTDLLQNLDDYASPNPLTVQYENAGKEWLKRKSFFHEWVFQGGDPKEKQKRLKESLKTSVIGVSVVGWKEKYGLFFKDEDEPDNHWAYLVAYEDDCPIVADCYPPFIRKLVPNYDFGFAKRYLIEKKQIDTIESKSLFANFRKFLCSV